MDKTCNIYYNRLTRKWEFYKVSMNGEESLFHDLDLKGLEEGDGIQISWEHLVEIKRYFNLPEININIYEDTPELIAGTQNPKDESIHIKILRNEYILKKAEEIENLLRDSFPNITLTEFIKGKDEEDISCLEYVISSIKSIIDDIDDRESRFYKIISDTYERTKNLSPSKSDRQQYKDILRKGLKDLLQNVNIDSSMEEDVKLYFNKGIPNDKIFEFIQTNLKSVEELPIIDTSNRTMGAIRAFAKSMSASTTISPIMRGSVAGVFGASFLTGMVVVIFVMWRNIKNLELKNLQIMQDFWSRFCKQLKTLLEDHQSSFMKLICVCPKEEAYAKLEEAKNIIDTLH